MRGRFLTFEGGEGSGKSTLIRAVAEGLRQRDIELILTREPGGTPLAETLRSMVLTPDPGSEPGAMTQALMVNAARCDHLERLIKPALSDGKWVLSDRFADSTRAYQGASGAELSDLLALEALVLGDTRPDLTIVLDAAPEALLDRRIKRGSLGDAFEDAPLVFHKDIRQRFLDIAKTDADRCVVLDALDPPDRLRDQVLQLITERFGS